MTIHSTSLDSRETVVLSDISTSLWNFKNETLTSSRKLNTQLIEMDLWKQASYLPFFYPLDGF